MPRSESGSEGLYKSASTCLMLLHDDAGGKVEVVRFMRDEQGNGDIDAAAAEVLGLRNGEHVRCFSLPGPFDKKMGMALHMYMAVDMEGHREHKMAHNTNASQLWLGAHLPQEPPEVTPSSIHGPVLITADDIKTEEFVELTMEHWESLKKLCRDECDAIFMN